MPVRSGLPMRAPESRRHAPYVLVGPVILTYLTLE